MALLALLYGLGVMRYRPPITGLKGKPEVVCSSFGSVPPLCPRTSSSQLVGYTGSDPETAIWQPDQPLGEVGSVLEVSPTIDCRDENVVQT